MLTWEDFLGQQERYKDLLREVERNRFIRQALARYERRNYFYCRALVWLGQRLIAWGWRLQERYSGGAVILTPQAANPTR